MNRRYKILIIVVVVFLAGIQLIPVTKENPPRRETPPAPASVVDTLKQSCYDCHSNEVVWPWYSNVAPVSWLVAHDVKEGREHVNFSEWSKYSQKDLKHIMEEMVEVLEEGEMPLKGYVLLHKGTELEPQEKEALIRWAKGE